MNALYLVLPLALVIATGAVAAFVWSVRAGQLDDFDTPPCRMLLDDHPARVRALVLPVHRVGDEGAAEPAAAEPVGVGAGRGDVAVGVTPRRAS